MKQLFTTLYKTINKLLPTQIVLVASMTQAVLSRYSKSVVRPEFVDSNKIEVVEVVYLSNEHT